MAFRSYLAGTADIAIITGPPVYCSPCLIVIAQHLTFILVGLYFD